MISLRLIVLFLAFPQAALACQEPIWSPEEYAHNSKSVYIGLVQSMSIPESNEYINIEKIERDKYVNLFRALGDVNVVLKVLESLKGETKKRLIFLLNWCGGGQYELGDLVVAYNLGESWHVKKTRAAIKATTKALTSNSSRTAESAAP